MKLAEYLSQNGIKAAAFAASLGVPSSTVTRWLRGERLPRLDALLKIQELTSGAVTPNDFLSEASSRPFPSAAEADA